MPTTISDMVTDANDDAVPIDGYYIDELPSPKKKEVKKILKQREERERVELPLQEHDFTQK